VAQLKKNKRPNLHEIGLNHNGNNIPPLAPILSQMNPTLFNKSKAVPTSLLSKNLKIKIYRTIILPVVLYGCETWSLTLREVRRLRVFENRVLRRVFGSKRDELKGEWRKLHNEELSDMYSLPNIVRVVKSRRMSWAGACGAYGGRERCAQGSGGET